MEMDGVKKRPDAGNRFRDVPAADVCVPDVQQAPDFTAEAFDKAGGNPGPAPAVPLPKLSKTGGNFIKYGYILLKIMV
ncbi:MAG: hypothetical protein LKJ73_01910 [Oscillospiraceae bacterium]|jgi:hypothetical protein|nr:hypothetical protein [Oscillospiraceae bacterium]